MSERTCIEVNYTVLPEGETLSHLGRVALVCELEIEDDNTISLMVAVGDCASHTTLADKIDNDRGRGFVLPEGFSREIAMVCAWSEPGIGQNLGAVYGLGGAFREDYEITDDESDKIVRMGGVATLAVLSALHDKAAPASDENHLTLDGKDLEEAISRFKHSIYGDTIRN